MTLPAFLKKESITLSPPGAVAAEEMLAGAGITSNNLRLSIDKQLQSNWCWAAVSGSIAKFYDQTSGWTQCQIANTGLERTDCCGSGASNRTRCNTPWFLDRALGLTANFVQLLAAPDPLAQPMSFDAIRSEIDNGRAIGTRVGWNGGGGHFQAITGWTVGTGGEEYITVSDPIYLDMQILLPDFAGKYQGGGNWTHAYLTAAAGPPLIGAGAPTSLGVTIDDEALIGA